MSAEPRIIGLGRAVPEQVFTQRELHALSPYADNALIDRLFLESPVQQRALFVPPDWYKTPRTLSDTNRAWREGALTLGSRALRETLSRARVAPEQVDMLGVTTVTGYTTPGLDLLLAQREGMRANIARAHFNCIGCHAAVPMLKVAADHAAAHPGSVAVALAVEICSACFANELKADNLVALALFADGAAGTAVSTEGTGPRIVGFASGFDYDHIDALGFELTMGGFRIILDRGIPDHIAHKITGVVTELLDAHNVRREQVSAWCFHPGGSKILDEVQRELGLSNEAMVPSRRVLARHGNMSSPTVMFVLAEAMRSGFGKPGTYGLMAAFGPGLGIEAALLAFD